MGVDVTIFEKCHHNIIYGKINIQVPQIQISNFNWTKAFENISVDEKVELLNETLLIIY